jgi:predicted permease
MDQFFLDLRIAARTLTKRRGFTIVALLTLALGTGATTAIFSVADEVLRKPLPYADAGRIVSLWGTARDNPGPNIVGTVSHLNYLDWKREATSFESMALYSATNFVVNGVGDADLIRGGTVTPDFFHLFKAAPVLGREFMPEEDLPNGPRVVVISYAFWQERLGGRPDVIGLTIGLSSGPTEIVGVAPRGFDFPNHASLWTPIQNNDQTCGRGCVYLDGIARVAGGVSVEQARTEMQAIALRLEKTYPATNTNVTVGVLRLQDEMVRDVRTALLFIVLSVFMVLLIACANVANLILVRGASRHDELAVRAALGGGRRRLMTHLLAENLLLALTGGSGGLLLARWGIDALKEIAPRDIPRLSEVAFDGRTFAFAAGITAFTMVVFGLGPSIRLSRAASIVSLLSHRGGVGSARAMRGRSILVGSEVALSLVLLVGAGLLLRSLGGLQSVDLGFKPGNVTIFTINLPRSRYPLQADIFRKLDELSAKFQAIPGVEVASRIAGLPLSGGVDVQTFARLDQPPPDPGKLPVAIYRTVDANYFRTMGIPLVSGRDFTLSDRDDPAGVIVSRKMAERFWPGEDPLGKRFQITGGPLLTIAGVVANVRSQQLAVESPPEMYLMKSSARTMTFVVRSAVPASQVLTSARQIVKQADPNLPLIRPGTMQGIVQQQMARTQFLLLLAGLFAVLAIVLASVGTYGVVAYAVAQRTREMGLRLALGASPHALVARVMWEGFRPVIIGLATGLAGAYGAARTVESLLFQVRPADPSTFFAVTLMLLMLGVIATGIPALRVAKISPATTLKDE